MRRRTAAPQRAPSLIERVAGVTRVTRPIEAKQAVEAKPAEPRFTGLERAEPIPPAAQEDDILDIPAFLRRQAN